MVKYIFLISCHVFFTMKTYELDGDKHAICFIYVKKHNNNKLNDKKLSRLF